MDYPTGSRRTHRLFRAWVGDRRDLIFVDTLVEMAVLPLLAALLFLLPTGWVLALAVPYLLLVFTRFAGRFVLMLHYLCHRPVFTRRQRWVSAVVTWVLGPLFGQTPNSFFVHHMGMHHPENNLEDDLSSTLAYQRDRFSHFLHYWARFFFFGHYHLAAYLIRRRRTKLLVKLLVGEGAWFAVVGLLLWVDPVPTLVVLVVPFLLMRWLMMCGNWAQHAFVDVDDAGNPYRNSTVLCDTPYNHKCYNDGYHIVHHLKPALHWTEMSTWFWDRQQLFADQGAVVFQGIGNNQVVWWCLMTGRYDTLAAHLWGPARAGRSEAELVAWLKQRVQRRAGTIKGFVERRESLASAR